jgi:hypothetical protein
MSQCPQFVGRAGQPGTWAPGQDQVRGGIAGQGLDQGQAYLRRAAEQDDRAVSGLHQVLRVGPRHSRAPKSELNAPVGSIRSRARRHSGSRGYIAAMVAAAIRESLAR